MNNYQDLPDPCSNTPFGSTTFMVEHKKRGKAEASSSVSKQSDVNQTAQSKTAAQSSS